MKRVVCIIAVMMMIVGCATASQISQFASSRVLPCASEEIVVTNIKTQGFSGLYSWDSTCKGKTYKCTGRTTGHGDMNDVTCKK